MLTVFSLKPNILEVLVSPPTPPLSSNADPFGRGAARPTPTLFLYSFSPSPRATQTFSPLHQPALSHLLFLSPPRLLLLPTGPHENTYFTGIHDGRRASVQTCLPGLPSDRLAPWALELLPGLTCLFSFYTFLFFIFNFFSILIALILFTIFVHYTFKIWTLFLFLLLWTIIGNNGKREIKSWNI